MNKRAGKRCGQAPRDGKSAPTLYEASRPKLLASLVSAVLAGNAAAGLVATLGLAALPAGTALGQTASCSDVAPDCTINPGNYSSSFNYTYTGTAPFTVTNNGAFSVTQPASGALGYYTVWARGQGLDAATSFSANAASGGAGAPLTVQEFQASGSGSIHTSPAAAYSAWFYANLLESWGGNGGLAGSSSYNGGAGAAGGGVNVTNSIPITVSPGNLGYGGSALEAHGIGGSGGDVQNDGIDGNGNPKYDGGGKGGTGAGGNAVILTNTGTIQAGSASGYLVGSAGYRGLGALSMGGNGGLGSAGAQGGSAGPVTVTNSAPANVYWYWSGAAPADPFAPAFPAPQPLGVWGILASSTSGNGTQSVTSQVDGGSAGGSGAASVSVKPGGDITIGTIGTANGPGAGIGAFSTGGTGGAGYDKSVGGAGGSVSSTSTTPAIAVDVSHAAINVFTSSDQVSGIVAMATGGTGGAGGLGQDNSDGGGGGSVGSPTTQGVNVTLNSAAVSNASTAGAGIVASVTGGGGGKGTDYENELATGSNDQPCYSTSGFARSGCGGGGGNTSAVNVTLVGTSSAPSSVVTGGTVSPGIVAITQGGPGGTGGELTALNGTTGAGGPGGQGAPVTVTLDSASAVQTLGGPGTAPGSASFGIVASSRGGAGGTGGEAGHGLSSKSGDGGDGGGSDDVNVTIISGANVGTFGEKAAAIVAQSLSGPGGAAGLVFGGIVSQAGSGGAGGNTGNVAVANSGFVSTSGTDAPAVIAQAISGGGGAGGTGNGVFFASGGAGGSSGTVGTVSVTNAGTVTTYGGTWSHGILAQAIGGGGGAAGPSTGGIITSLGGAGALAASGGNATVTQTSGSINTAGASAIGLLAQSIGGGGGDGGGASGELASIGGSAGGGGGGGTVTVQQTGGWLTTSNTQAHGIVAQSIGGGGGNAGNATSQAAFAALAIGGTGGGGGDGGTALVNSQSATIQLQGSQATGIAAQSIGGGGGTGGAAYALSASVVLDAAVAVGGSGATGGNGASTTVALSSSNIGTGQASPPTQPTNLLPVDAFGIVAQSVGGGGGMGGSAAAQAVAIAIPIPPDPSVEAGVAVSTSVGGSAGNGGTGGSIGASLANGAAVTTQYQGSHGIVAQSIGGGGGLGGDSSALSATLSYGRAATEANQNPWTADVSVAVGGGGGKGGGGGAVAVEIGGASGVASGTGTVTTYGDYADGVLAQAIGGGGGNAGFGSTTTIDFGATRNLQVGVGVGGSGGVAGDGCVMVSGTCATTTSVTLYPRGSIVTYGAGAIGIVAQSIGGGGGASQGGAVDLGAAYTLGDGTTVTPAAQLSANWGGTGAAAGSGGQVTVDVQGMIQTSGGDAAGVLAQAIGGGGGLGGSAGADASADNPVSSATGIREFISQIPEKNVNWSAASFTFSLGGNGGAGGTGGEVDVTHSGTVTTRGDWAQGTVAQSIGGGGGKGGTATANSSRATASLSAAVGGGGGAGGDGDAVNVDLQGGKIFTGQTSSAGTTGFGAFGVLAQSIGGGGGTGIDGSASATGAISVGGGFGGGGGSSGDGGGVTVSGNGQIGTLGEQAHAVVLQSIGGGGGIGATGSSASAGFAESSGAPTSGTVSLNIGGRNGSSGNGETVTYDNPGVAITTSGANALGVLAQSIGGGGGLATAPGAAATTVTAAAVRASGGADGSGGAVTVALPALGSITTSGIGAHAIVAQSIGGGGGLAGFPTPTGTPTFTTEPVSTTSYGESGAVAVDIAGSVKTSGAGAFGVIAQSLGGGGGLTAQGSAVTAVTANGYYGGAVNVHLETDATLSVSGANSVGIFAQTSLGDASLGVPATIGVTVDGALSSSGFAGVWVDMGETNALTINAGGSVTASGNAWAAYYTGWAAGLNVVNHGTLTGPVSLSAGTFTNAQDATWVTGLADHRSVANVVNRGRLVVGRTGEFDRATIAGNLAQTGTGTIVVDADFRGRQADLLTVRGDAQLAGKLKPLYRNIVPGVALPVLEVEGKVTGTLRLDSSALFGFDLRRSGNQFLLLAKSANFAPPHFGLPRSRAAVADHLNSIWERGGNATLGPLFGLLGTASSPRPSPPTAGH